MNIKNEAALKLLAAAGLEKSLLRLTEVTDAAWRLEGVHVFGGTVREAIKRKEREIPTSAAIRIKIKGAAPFITAILYDPEDTKYISRCFAGEAFYATLDETQTDDTIIEIGNILLNALVNSLLRAFGRSAVPSVPAYFRGDPGAIEAWLGAGPEVFTIISAAFTMQRDGASATAEILAFLPPALAGETPPDK